MCYFATSRTQALLTLQIILVPTSQTLHYVEQSVNFVIMLKTFVSAIKKVHQALGPAQSDLLMSFREVWRLCLIFN